MVVNYVSGSSGFIGSQLVKRLANFTPLYREQLRVSVPAISLCRNIFFLSAYGNFSKQSDHFELFQANAIELSNALTAAITHGCDRFIYFSSSSVLLDHQTPYSLTKKAGESLVAASGIPHLIIRPFSVTGVGDQSVHLIPKLINSCMFDESVDFVPHPVHDWIDVSDLVAAVMHLLALGKTGTWNVGTGVAVSNLDVLRLVESATGKYANVQYVNSIYSYDTNNWKCPDNELRNTGWVPKKTLRQSISEMVAAWKP